MPTLEFKGKQHIYAHHLTVPYRPLKTDETRSCNPTGEDDNLIIHGDNLHALKALLPRYANRIKCIYIDPPYNTGNEGWCYNDNVNSPLMQNWLTENAPVDNEDMEKHDKWLCMMWPRLHLLKELLTEDGVIFISIDDNEVNHLRMLMDEIFGLENFIAQIVVQTNPRGRSLKQYIAQTHEYILMYAKDISMAEVYKIPKTEKALSEYNKEDENGAYRLLRLRNTGIQFFNRETRPNLFFPIYVNPTNEETSLIPSTDFSVKVLPETDNGIEGCWTWSKEKINKNPELIVGRKVRNGKWRIYRKDYLKGESLLTMPKSLLAGTEVNHEVGKEMLTKLFSSAPFEYPKSTALIESLVRIACKGKAIILDSFAGSGTTAHAVLALNKEDGGNRQFILIECEDYADTITAERVRRVINGVPDASDDVLREGLGGSFTYCTLGEPVDTETMLTGDSLPEFHVLAAHLLWTTSGISIGPVTLAPQNSDGLFHSHDENDYYLLYKPDLDYLRSDDAVFNLERAERIRDACGENGRKAIVYAAGKYIGQRELMGMGIIFCQLPDALHKR